MRRRTWNRRPRLLSSGHSWHPIFPVWRLRIRRGAASQGDLVPGRFRAKARVWRERHHPASIEIRHTRNALDRRVEFLPDIDGMAWFNTYLPADTAAGIWARTTAEARALQSPNEARTLAQLRADVAATLLQSGHLTPTGTAVTGTGGDTAGAGEGAGPEAGAAGVALGAGDFSGARLTGDVPSPRAQVLVTVPVLSLLGVTDEPAMLDGYGPVPPSMARRLVADGADSFYRVLTDPRDGAPLEIGRTSYRLTKPQRQWLRLRDGRCPFPGCNNPSLDNEADHLLAWTDGGTTGISNLGQPCRKHHSLKHNSAWTPTRADKDHPPGWTSPAGRTYPSEHQDWEPPHLPDELLPDELLPDELLPDELLPDELLPDELVPDELLPYDPVLDREPPPDWEPDDDAHVRVSPLEDPKLVLLDGLLLNLLKGWEPQRELHAASFPDWQWYTGRRTLSKDLRFHSV